MLLESCSMIGDSESASLVQAAVGRPGLGALTPVARVCMYVATSVRAHAAGTCQHSIGICDYVLVGREAACGLGEGGGADWLISLDCSYAQQGHTRIPGQCRGATVQFGTIRAVPVACVDGPPGVELAWSEHCNTN